MPLSQKAFNALHTGKTGILPAYAGRTLLIAVIFYTTHLRKPQAIIQIDSERIRILGDGSIDMNHELDGLHLAANRLDRPKTKLRSSGIVVDATAQFEDRQWDARHPALSGLSYKRLVDALFK